MPFDELLAEIGMTEKEFYQETGIKQPEKKPEYKKMEGEDNVFVLDKNKKDTIH